MGFRPAAAAVLASLLITSPLLVGAAPFAVGPGPGVDPSQFRVTTFAGNLPYYPTGFLQLPDGSYLVAANDPSAGTGFYTSAGKLVRLVDANHDGVADSSGTVLNAGLPGGIVQMRLAGNVLILNSAVNNAQKISFMRLGATPADPLTTLGSINFTFPSNQVHDTYALAVRPGGPAGAYELFFNVGSRVNNANNTTTVPISGLASATLDTESIYRLPFTDDGTSLSFSAPQQVAKGLRNAAGLAFHPATGDLYFQDNGIDGSPDPNEPLSVDELNVIPRDQIGAGVPDFGFATDYIQYRTGTRIGSGAVQPIVTFQPIPDPFTGSESEGATEITFAPDDFPAGLNTGLFVGFHGKFNLAGVANEENPVLYVDPATGNYFDFLSNDLPDIGHIDNLFATADSLFLVDINSAGNMFSSTPSGAIYQVSVIPEPAAGLAVGFVSILLMLPSRRLRAQRPA